MNQPLSTGSDSNSRESQNTLGSKYENGAEMGKERPAIEPNSSESGGESKERPGQARSAVDDFLNRPAPTWKQKVRRYFYMKGYCGMPAYMKDIYRTIPRYVYVNYDLPEDLTDPVTGFPRLSYPRNKIRTTKYTPLSFLPKNLLIQFTNIANGYFLLVVILGAFEIFGVADPGLAAVPLIVIVCITAVKDAIEDYRRAVSDSELNNSPIHLLTGIDNVNVITSYVGPWRRIKKKCTKITFKCFRGIKKFSMYFAKRKTRQEYIRKREMERENILHRVSTVVSDNSVRPRYSTSSRASKKPFTKPSAHSILNPAVFAEERKDAVFKNRSWKDVSVGDIIRVRNDEEVPADLVLLSTSDPEGGCFVETKNLDGETNLKPRTCIKSGGIENIKHSKDLANTKFWIECDAPNSNLYAFKGTLHYENYDENGTLINPDEKEVITNNNVLLRGCTLRNTKWVLGVVVYTGSETKVMLNSGITPTKISRISKQLNFSVTINFVLLFILCFVSGLVNGLFYRKKDTSRVYFDFKPYGATPAANGVITFFVGVINYQCLVPISLYITIEIIKTLQALFIYLDQKMYYPRLDFPCKANSWNISDDLGQIEYIFSDKTGTLTQNVMSFRKCSINGKSYGLAYTEAKQGLDKRQGVDVTVEEQRWKDRISKDKEAMLSNLHENIKGYEVEKDLVTFVSNEYVEDTVTPDAKTGAKQKEMNELFMLALSLCHTVITEENKKDPSKRDFKAESPDENALVSAARDVGIEFKMRQRSKLTVQKYGRDIEFEELDSIAFSSQRKRMSSIVQSEDGKIFLFSKGADNVIFSRLDSRNNDEELIRRTALHLEDYANEGLRTLCVAYKELDQDTYDSWHARYNEALSSIADDRDDLITEVEDEIEQGLILLGGTAIEDKLQEGVPTSIEILSRAGIKLWVLTGDKVETAINIGFSCNLLENSMKLLVVRPDEKNLDDQSAIDALLTTHLRENFGILQDATNEDAEIKKLITAARKDHSTPSSRYALIIDGAALRLIFDTELDTTVAKNIREKFLLLGKQCKSVICCRVSPSQKANVLKIVKNSLQVMTLAIGDGANDVAMIQSAHVGVGIAGEEGRQATMTADYAIGQFRFLTRLLLVHGRWSYKRLGEMIPCFFYKNIVFTLTLFWYGIYSNFDGAELYEYTYLMFYNLAFTSLPVIVLAVFDQDVSATVSLLVPELYKSGILGLEWSQYKFLWYMFDGLYQSVISYFFPYLLYYKGFPSPHGLPIDHRFWISIVAIQIAVISCDLYVLLRQYRWDWFCLLIDAISILLVYFWSGVWSAGIRAAEFFKAGAQVLGTLSCWCTVFIGVIGCLLPRFTHDFLLQNFKPRDIDIIREQVFNGVYDKYPEGYDPTNAEDLEKMRLLQHVRENDPELLKRIEENISNENQANNHKEIDEDANPLKKRFETIKRRATISKHNKLNHRSIYKLDLNQLRLQMIKEGQYDTGSRNSLERISTTHELPGLTQAESLISYHTRNSLNFNK